MHIPEQEKVLHNLNDLCGKIEPYIAATTASARENTSSKRHSKEGCQICQGLGRGALIDAL